MRLFFSLIVGQESVITRKRDIKIVQGIEAVDDSTVDNEDINLDLIYYLV